MWFIIECLLLAIIFDIAIIVVLRMIGKRRPRMSYSEYLQKYGGLGPYDSSDISKYT